MKGGDVTLISNFVHPLSKYVFVQKYVVKIFCQLCVHTVGYKKIGR